MTEVIPWARASAPPPSEPVPLRGAARADVCVVGGGLTGLSAARALAAVGASVVLLEAGRVGDGASGLNGGQMIPGFRHGAAELIRRFGPEIARRLHTLTLDAREAMLRLAERHPVDLKTTGHLTAASRARDLGWMREEVEALATLGHCQAELVERDGMSAYVAAGGYHGGLFDRLGGHVHPVKLVQALAAEAVGAGATVHETSRVESIKTGARPTVRTAAGSVSAAQVVLACDAFLDTLAVDGWRPAPARRLMPVWSYSVATAPLGADAAPLLPGDAAVSDTRFALDYFRLSADRRLLFSGGERYVLRPLRQVEPFVRRRLARVFPALAATRIDHAWAGRVAVTTTRFPQVGRSGPLWFAHGYSGHGLLLAQAAGAAVGRAIMGERDDYNLLAALPTRDWPGGRLLRYPLYTAGMLWFAAKDRL